MQFKAKQWHQIITGKNLKSSHEATVRSRLSCLYHVTVLSLKKNNPHTWKPTPASEEQHTHNRNTNTHKHTHTNTGMVAESIERMLRVRETGTKVPGQVQPKTYCVHICGLLAWYLTLLQQRNDWFSQCQVNVTEWDIGSWWCWPHFQVGQHYKVAIRPHRHKSVPIMPWS